MGKQIYSVKTVKYFPPSRHTCMIHWWAELFTDWVHFGINVVLRCENTMLVVCVMIFYVLYILWGILLVKIFNNKKRSTHRLHVRCLHVWHHIILESKGCGGGRPSSVMSLGVASVGGHSHGHPASPIGVGSFSEDTDPRSPKPLVVRGGWLWLIWVVRWTT